MLKDLSVFVQLLQKRLQEGARRGEEGVLLDGFPRTRAQAESLLTFSDVQLALNLSLREDVSALLLLCATTLSVHASVCLFLGMHHDCLAMRGLSASTSHRNAVVEEAHMHCRCL